MSKRTIGFGVSGTWLAAVGAAMVSFAVSGCGVGTLAGNSGPAAVPSANRVTGRAMGGQQPIYNATIQLWAAGMTGTYGTGATSLLTSTVTTGANGSFDITGKYSCPTPDPQIYLTATGGDPTGAASTSINNTDAQLVVALGSCSGVLASVAANTGYFIQVNEVTTAAAAFALAQFYGGFGTTTDQIGAPATNLAGLTNAFATAHNLASVLSGTPTPTTAASGTNYYMSSNDNQKLNTIANILADCVNQMTASSTVCTNLYAYVRSKYAPGSTSTTSTAPVNTFQSAVYMNLNPLSVDTSGASNLANLFNMQSAFAPFATALSATPTDWTLAVNYTGTGISDNSGVAVDSNGDIWMSNANAVGGAVMLNGGTGTAGGTAGVAGGVIGFYTSPSGYAPLVGNGARSIAIDANNKAWFSNFSATGTTQTGGGSFMCGSTGSTTPNGYYLFRAASTGVDDFVCFTSVFNPYAVAISGNSVYASTTTNTLVYTSVTQPQGYNITTKTSTGGSSGNINLVFTPQISSPATASFGLLAGTSSSGSISNINSFTTGSLGTATVQTVSTGSITTPYGAALDRNGNLWVANNGTVGSNASSLTVVGTPTGTPSYTNYSNTCLQKPGFIAVDGYNNIWVTNQTSTTVNSTTQYTVCEFDASGNLLSNTAGFNQHGVNNGRGIAIDRSGNVWLTSYTTGAQQVTQLVGAAAPVVTPLVAQINSGTNKVGIRP